MDSPERARSEECDRREKEQHYENDGDLVGRIARGRVNIGFGNCVGHGFLLTVLYALVVNIRCFSVLFRHGFDAK